MTADLLAATTGAALVAVAAVYIVLFIATLLCALRGDMPKALLCGMALLTMIWPGLGLIVLIVILIISLFTRNIELIAPVATGFILAMVLYIVLVTVIGTGVMVFGGEGV